MLFRKVIKAVVLLGFWGATYAETSANVALKRSAEIQKKLEPWEKSWMQGKVGCGFYVFFIYRRDNGLLKVNISYRYHDISGLGQNYCCMPTEEQKQSHRRLLTLDPRFEETVGATGITYYQRNLIIVAVDEKHQSVKSFEFKSYDDPVYDAIEAKFSKGMDDGANEKVAYFILTKGGKKEHVVIFFNTHLKDEQRDLLKRYVATNNYNRVEARERSDIIKDRQSSFPDNDDAIDTWTRHPVAFSFDPQVKKDTQDEVQIYGGTLYIKYDATGNPEKAGYSEKDLRAIKFVNVSNEKAPGDDGKITKTTTAENNSINAEKASPKVK